MTEKRLIYANAADDAIAEAADKYDGYDSCQNKILQGFMEAQDALASVPTVDAVEVVRCEECIYATEEDGDLYCDGPIGIFGTVGFNDFCSCGERREGE